MPVCKPRRLTCRVVSWHVLLTCVWKLLIMRGEVVCICIYKQEMGVKSGCVLLALPCASPGPSRFNLPVPGWVPLSLHHGL
jgi:hypothetical protein